MKKNHIFYFVFLTALLFVSSCASKPEDLIVGKWQMDLDLSIIELAKSIALNSKESHIAGKNSNAFGKETYEKIIRMMVKDMG
ncbi:MAG: hypothetical protein IKB95_07775, partial [Bacteroidales bacterium]|nr:hypothetical protein [Bacteroidales bacterium]